MSTKKRAIVLGVSIVAGLAVIGGLGAAVVIENPVAGVTCAIVQDADVNLELLRTDEEIATAGSVACRAVLD